MRCSSEQSAQPKSLFAQKRLYSVYPRSPVLHAQCMQVSSVSSVKVQILPVSLHPHFSPLMLQVQLFNLLKFGIIAVAEGTRLQSGGH